MISIALARYFRKLGLVKRVLVLVPSRVNKGEWLDQICEHSPRSKTLILRGSSKQKWEDLLGTDALFVVETYAGLIRMVCQKTQNRKTGKLKLKPNKTLVRRLTDQFDMLVGDESTAVQNHAALPYRICKQIAKQSKAVYMLTGTPFNRDPTSLWAQMNLVDFGETLGETLGLFRAAFFSEKVNYWGGFEYTFVKRKEKLLHRFLANRSISYEADEASLPKVVEVPKYVALPEDAELYYQRALQSIREAKGNYQEQKNMFLRMRQISSGFVGYKEDETGEAAKFVFPVNPKMEMLLSVVRAMRPEHKAIIFYDFTFSGLSIVQRLKEELDLDPLILYGGTRDPEAVRDQFKKDPSRQILVLQNQFGFGLNIQVAKFGIYYESPVSAIVRKQTRRRVERQHSLHKTVFIYDLICRGCVDEKILQFHKEGGDLFQAIVRGEVKL